MRCTFFKLSIPLVATLILGGSPAPAGAAAAPKFGDAGRGEALFRKWCVACHALDTASLADQVPSKAALSAKYATKAAALKTFLTQPHRPMPPLELSNQEILDIGQFLLPHEN